jgi:phosphatidylinositol alpha-1,6-mannosyltransferase
MDELYKGHDTILRSLPLVAARVPDVRWVVIGHGSYEAYYRRLADSLNVADHVVFLGAVSDQERDHWYRVCRLFAMPSRATLLDGAGEGFGVAYLEAGAWGKPVLAARAGGALDSVEDGVSGVLVAPESVGDLADALIRLLVDSAYAESLGRQGWQRVRDRFSWSIVARQTEQVVHDVAGSKTPG